jgi:hypothetical protein
MNMMQEIRVQSAGPLISKLRKRLFDRNLEEGEIFVDDI